LETAFCIPAVVGKWPICPATADEDISGSILLAKAKLKRGAKKARKRVRAVKPPSTPAVETVVVDVIEEPVPGVTVVTEFEATEVRDESGATPAPPESEEP